MSSSAVLRDACDACHARKTRCPSEGVGACGNCRRTGQVCQFSPRSEMGRPRLGSSSSRRRHSERMNSRSSINMGMGNMDIMTTTPPPTPSLETNMHVVTGHPLLPDRYQPDAVTYSIDETSTTGRDAEMDNTYMETQPSHNSMSVTSSTLEGSRHSSTPVPTTSSWGSMIGPLTDTPTVIPDLYMLDNSWMTSTSSPAIPIVRDQTYGAKAATPSAASSTSSSSSRRSPAFPPSSSIPIPSVGAVTGATAYINKTNGLLEAYSQLSHILYSLRNLPSLAGSSSDQRRAVDDQTFALVSSLCDILTWLGNDQGATGGDLPPYLLLVASVMASVMDIYHKTGEAHKRELQLAVAHDNIDHRHQQQQQQAKSNTTTSTHQHAVILSDMTIMEFHLARLQLTLGETQLAASDDYTQTLTRLEHVRAFLRSVIDDFHVGVRD